MVNFLWSIEKTLKFQFSKIPIPYQIHGFKFCLIHVKQNASVVRTLF